MFWKGTDDNLWEACWDGTRWNGPASLGMGPLGSEPSAGVDAHGHQYVFWKGTDNNLWEAWWDGTRWNGPASLGMGPLGSAPGVAVSAEGNQYVFWKGTDDNLWEAWWDGTRWNGPASLGMGPLGSEPSAGVDAHGHQYVFWKGTDNNLWEAWWDGTRWNGPANVQTGGANPPVRRYSRRVALTHMTGWVQVDIASDGSSTFSGHVHNDAAIAEAFTFKLRVTIGKTHVAAFQHAGSVGGTGANPDQRNHYWSQSSQRTELGIYYDDIAAPDDIHVYEEREGSITGVLQKIGNLVVDLLVGVVVEEVFGTVIFVGAEIYAAVSDEVIPTNEIVSGIFFVLGPQYSIYGFNAAALVFLSQQRRRTITQTEWQWANDQVFAGTLPPPEKILISDSLGSGGRPFTFPSVGGAIMVNLGPGSFDKPSEGSNAHTFIHELTHAWQITHTPLEVAWLADAFATQLRNQSTDQYMVGPYDGRPWENYNLEQQAVIVETWWESQHADDPFFRYVEGNIRLGVDWNIRFVRLASNPCATRRDATRRDALRCVALRRAANVGDTRSGPGGFGEPGESGRSRWSASFSGAVGSVRPARLIPARRGRPRMPPCCSAMSRLTSPSRRTSATAFLSLAQASRRDEPVAFLPRRHDSVFGKVGEFLSARASHP